MPDPAHPDARSDAPALDIRLDDGVLRVSGRLSIARISETEQTLRTLLERSDGPLVIDKPVTLDGEDCSVQVTSRSVATENSTQKFISNVIGNTKCFGHVECDAIIKDNGKVIAKPEITANCVDSNLIHEAAIGKIAGEQLIKLMTLGLNEKEAEAEIINGFLK